MGWNTTVVIMNDSLHDIAKDPDFGKKLAAAIREAGVSVPGDGIQVSAGSSCNAALVVAVHHADYTSLIAVEGNRGKELYCGLHSVGLNTDKDCVLLLDQARAAISENVKDAASGHKRAKPLLQEERRKSLSELVSYDQEIDL